MSNLLSQIPWQFQLSHLNLSLIMVISTHSTGRYIFLFLSAYLTTNILHFQSLIPHSSCSLSPEQNWYLNSTSTCFSFSTQTQQGHINTAPSLTGSQQNYLTSKCLTQLICDLIHLILVPRFLSRVPLLPHRPIAHLGTVMGNRSNLAHSLSLSGISPITFSQKYVFDIKKSTGSLTNAQQKG